MGAAMLLLADQAGIGERGYQCDSAGTSDTTDGFYGIVWNDFLWYQALLQLAVLRLLSCQHTSNSADIISRLYSGTTQISYS